MRDSDAKFLEGCFKRYYFEHFDMVSIPDRTREREFGFQRFGSGMIRHIQLKDERELRLLLMQNSPSDVYCSNACYSFPNLAMKEKDWREADLIFDIDAKDLDLGCRPSHTVMICNDCGAASTSKSGCPKCGSTRLEPKSLPCKYCIAAAKEQVRRLIDMLYLDLGIDRQDIRTYFSGNEGFHLHVSDPRFARIGARERSDLVDYVMFKNVIPETFGMTKSKPSRDSFPNIGERGWRGRFAKQVFGSKSKRPKVIAGLVAQGYQSFQRTLEMLSSEAGIRVDPGVTGDIHRIFRLAGSINGKSGLTKTPCEDLDKFDPYTDASFLPDDPVEIRASCPVQFRLRGKKFGPYSDDTVKVPSYAAAYMICKKLAQIP